MSLPQAVADTIARFRIAGSSVRILADYRCGSFSGTATRWSSAPDRGGRRQ